MGEKLNLVLIIVLFLLIVGLSYCFNLKTNSKIIVIDKNETVDYLGYVGIIAECPDGLEVISGGCYGPASWAFLRSFGPIKEKEFLN